jgi:hypothetical protein
MRTKLNPVIETKPGEASIGMSVCVITALLFTIGFMVIFGNRITKIEYSSNTNPMLFYWPWLGITVSIFTLGAIYLHRRR